MASQDRQSFTNFVGYTRQSLKRIEKLLRCVLCKRFPHPDYLMVCKNNHFLCGRCAWTLEPFCDRKTKKRKPCCASENLTKGVCPLLSDLMKNYSYWERNLHVNRIESDCPYFGCKEKLNVGDETIRHLVKEHGVEIAKIGDGKPLAELTISIGGSFEGAESGSLTIVEVKLEHGDNEKYLLTVRLVDNVVYIWLWDFQQIKKDEESNVTYLLALKAFGTPWMLQYREVCAPYWKSSSEIIEDANCLALPRDIFMKKYVTQGPEEESFVSKMVLAVGV